MVTELKLGGVYHRKPENDYVRIMGMFQPQGTPTHFDYQNANGVLITVPIDHGQDWTYCPFHRDIPDAEDPLLPDEFAGRWDVSRLSDLHAIGVWNCHRQLASLYGFDVDDPETLRAYNQRAARWAEDNQVETLLAAVKDEFPAVVWLHTNPLIIKGHGGLLAVVVDRSYLQYIVSATDSGDAARRYPKDLAGVLAALRRTALDLRMQAEELIKALSVPPVQPDAPPEPKCTCVVALWSATHLPGCPKALAGYPAYATEADVPNDVLTEEKYLARNGTKPPLCPECSHQMYDAYKGSCDHCKIKARIFLKRNQ
jgi:hypothetical protein